MTHSDDPYYRSILRQIEINRARTPDQRFQALCDLLDSVRAMAPRDAAACERRRRAMAAKQQEREQFRAQCRRWLAAQRNDLSEGV